MNQRLPEVGNVGLDRETYTSVVLPGFVLAVALAASSAFIPDVWDWLSHTKDAKDTRDTAWIVGLALVVALPVMSLFPGYLNEWLSVWLFQRAIRQTPERQLSWAWARVRERLPEVLPYDAIADPGSNSFYQSLTQRVVRVVGPVEQLGVQRQGRQIRAPLDVAADLMDAWLTIRSESASSLVRAWREKENMHRALSTAFALSLAFPSLGLLAWAIAKGGWAVLVGPAAVLLTYLAVPLYRRFVVVALVDWVNGQNLLSRLFWAARGDQPE